MKTRGPSRGGLAPLSRRQAGILNRLLDPRRMAILSELEAMQSPRLGGFRPAR